MRRGIALGFCLAIWLLSLVSAHAQAPIPDIQPERQEKAKLFGVGYMEMRVLGLCEKLLPGVPQITAAGQALSKVLTGSNLTNDEIRAIGSHVDKLWEKYEVLFTTNPLDYSQCTATAQLVGGQIATGVFDGLKPKAP